MEEDFVLLIRHRCVFELKSYAESRKNNVVNGIETPALAALLFEKYSIGMADTLKQFDGEFLEISNEIIKISDQICEEIDPNFIKNRKTRWKNKRITLSCL